MQTSTKLVIYFPAFIVLCFLVFVNCNSPFSPESKPTLPPDHDDNEEMFFHKSGKYDPYERLSSCSAYNCHHSDLRGGSSVAQQNEAPNRHVETIAPSCYQCHGKEWDQEEPSQLRFTYPFKNEIWYHGQIVFTEWLGSHSSHIRIEVMQGDALVGVLQERIAADGVLRDIVVAESWGSGNDFSLKLIDDNGRTVLTPTFSIHSVDNTIRVLAPNTTSFLRHNEPLNLEWRKGSGESIEASLYKGDALVEVIVSGAANSEYLQNSGIPASWGSGRDFQIKIVDSDGNVGWSAPFSIEP